MSEPKHTIFAQQALDLADIFKLRMAAQPIPGMEGYTIELAVPDGPSTGGGVQSLQAIKLMPRQDGHTLVVGHADRAAKRMDLRTFEVLGEQYQARFGMALPFTHEVYEGALNRLKSFFQEHGFRVGFARPEPRPEVAAASPGPAGARRGINAKMVFVAVVGALLGAVAMHFVR